MPVLATADGLMGRRATGKAAQRETRCDDRPRGVFLAASDPGPGVPVELAHFHGPASALLFLPTGTDTRTTSTRIW